MKGSILILDYGTSAVKAVLYNDNFEIVAKRTAEFCYQYLDTHCIEFDADKYCQIALLLMKELIDETNSADTLEVISVTSQAETLICIDGKGKVLGNAIVWLDTRAQEESNYLRASIGTDDLYKITGLTDFDPVMPLCKLLWMKNNDTTRYKNTQKFLLLKDYITFFLTGIMATDYSVSSCTGYFNITAKSWEQPLLDAAGIDIEKLPEPLNAQAIIGNLLPWVAEKIGCNKTVPVVNGMLDQCASAIGSKNIREGVITETTGSVLAVAATIPDFSPELFSNKMPVMCHGLDGRYLALPNCPTGGILLKWFKDNFLQAEQAKLEKNNEDIYKYIDRCIEEKVQFKNNLVFLPHFCGYLSPISNPAAKGVLYGMTLDTNRFDIALSIMEGISFLLRENINLLNQNGIASTELISLGGGARSQLWLRIKANTTHLEIQTLENEESTSLGGAINAAIAIKKLSNEDEIYNCIKLREKYYPEEKEYGYLDEKFALYQKINRQLEFI